MIDSRGPVGVFDSGLGGLSVLRAVRALLPHEDIVYVADSGNAPYGGRDDAFIIERSLAISEWLLGQHAKAMVVACNTATAQAVHLLRTLSPIPLVGVEPGLKPAAAISKTGVAGVLATASTLRSEKFRRLLDEHQTRCRYLCQPGLGLVEMIERGDTDSPALMALLEQYLAPMLAEGADTLVLGCTHYPFVDTAIRRITGDRLTIVDTSAAIAQQLARLLGRPLTQAESTPDAADRPQGRVRLCTTGDPEPLAYVARTLLGLEQSVEILSIPSRHTHDGSPAVSV
ncbi:glutamate racemase [Pararobbsia silviterrae]|uniref:Glutamate racemase n=1 Tax=Pararobbsia silviterrae TaxID=1792498 RepID=A0A494YC68_9BURK|nr:glutamate racemase [Pararobbsia silviterrae]RKP57564.1 glutamate racemase [Pararobbsia silviterrae]